MWVFLGFNAQHVAMHRLLYVKSTVCYRAKFLYRQTGILMQYVLVIINMQTTEMSDGCSKNYTHGMVTNHYA